MKNIIENYVFPTFLVLCAIAFVIWTAYCLIMGLSAIVEWLDKPTEVIIIHQYEKN